MAWGKDITSKQRQSVKLPDKFKCKYCYKWKEPAAYSKKEIGSYTWKAGNGTSLNGASAGLRCRQCTGGALQEKECQGPCGIWRDLQKFSKASRSAGGNQWCQECTLWKLSAEPGVTTQAPPTGDLAPDEEDELLDQPTAPRTYIYDPEVGDEDSDGDYDFPGGSTFHDDEFIPTDAPAATGTRGNSTSAAPPSWTVCSQAPSTILGGPLPRVTIPTPYDLPALSNLSLGTGKSPTSNISANKGNATGLRSNPAKALWTVIPSSDLNSRNTTSTTGATSGVGGQSDIKSNSSVSNIYEGISESAWGPVDARRREIPQPPVKFTGWDNRGQAHSQIRNPSASEHTPSKSTSTSAPIPRPANRPAPVPAPAESDANSLPWGPAEPIEVGRNGWAKAVGGRNTALPYDAKKVREERLKSEAVQRPRRGNDDEDEDDDLYDM